MMRINKDKYNKKLKEKKINKTKTTIKDKTRVAEIISVFSKHNFYINGLNPKELRTTLEDLGPTYVKIGQIASSRSDLLPKAYCDELIKLRASVAPLEASVVRKVIEEETGLKIEDIYETFNEEPLGSASIAQAHFGILKDGTKVVTKVQRPGIDNMIHKDFELLKKLASMIGSASSENEEAVIDFESVVLELEKVTYDELDFRVEANNTKQFQENCVEDEAKVNCPTIIDKLTTKRILTMSFVDGYSISKYERIEEDGYSREEIGIALINNYLHQILDVGVFHGDPHQGNIMVSHGVPYWIDFGMIGKISDRAIDNLQNIIFGLLTRDAEDLANAALSMGVPTQKVNRSKLIEDIDVLMERYSSITDLDVGELMNSLISMLGEHHMSVPGEYTMLVRGLITFEGVIEELCPKVNLLPILTKKMIERAKQNFDVKETLTSAVEGLAFKGLKAAKLPNLVSDLLSDLSRGRLKIGLELTGYGELVDELSTMARNIIYAIFACVIFIGSSTLATTNIEPSIYEIPVVSLIGFLISIALGIYSVVEMRKK